MGLCEVDDGAGGSYWVVVLSKNGVLVANTVPSRYRADQEQQCASFLASLKEQPRSDVKYDTAIASLLVRLFTEPGDEETWKQAGQVKLANAGNKVLVALREVGPGEVVSYAELAERALGNRKAARAVGTAMRLNNNPLIAPCHRVIMTSGQLGNFNATGGVATKRALLEREKPKEGKKIKL